MVTRGSPKPLLRVRILLPLLARTPCRLTGLQGVLFFQVFGVFFHSRQLFLLAEGFFS